jgi:predicted enzyme related to lactoylglutathione lyase
LPYFEIPSDNFERTKKFYSDLFGWKMERMPSPREYWMFSTTNHKGGDDGGGGKQRQSPAE